MSRLIRPAVSLLLLFTALLGIAYPLIITGAASTAFADRAAGSLIYQGGRAVGSSLIGQSFSDPKYFWGRPSATTPQPYNGLASTGSNLGPLNPALIDQVKANAKALRDADAHGDDHGNGDGTADERRQIPVDLVTASASGLDPEISVAGAYYQAGRVARARNLPPARVEALIRAQQEGRLFGFIGEHRVNVLALNVALDRLR
jgi:K+-transporting ATPase ATPase C chain